MGELIEEWKTKLGISNWCITTEKINPTARNNKEEYSIITSIDWDNLSGVIHHDIDLTEETIIRELLHVRYPEENEDWINEMTKQYIHSKYKY